MSEKLLQLDEKSRTFQLYLLSFMRVEPAILSEALRRLGATQAELATASASLKERGYEMIGGPRVEFYRDLLGPPFGEAPTDTHIVPAVFHDSKELRFKLPLWADFDFVVNELPDGRTL